MVPPKPEKRPQRDDPAADRHRAPRLWQGVRRISKEGVLLPQPKAMARENPPLTKLQKELLERMPLLPKGTPRPKVESRGHPHDPHESEEMVEVLVEPDTEHSELCKLPTARPKPKKRPAPRDASDEPEKRPEPKAWPLDPSWPPAPATPGQPPPRTANLDKPFAEILKSGKNRAQGRQAPRATLSTRPTPQVKQAGAMAIPAAVRPKRQKSIWFDTTAPSEMAAAMKPRKKASRRQMFQTVLLISAANRAADAQQDADGTPQSRPPQRVYKSVCAVSLAGWNHILILPWAWQRDSVICLRSSDTMTDHPGKAQWDCSQMSPQLWTAPPAEHLPRHQPGPFGVFHAPSALCPVNLPGCFIKHGVVQGRGNSARTTLDNRPRYWQVRSLALYQSLAALPGAATGLTPPPRTETSIPVRHWHGHPVWTEACRFRHLGLPSSLAAGHAEPYAALHQNPTSHPWSQGWVDCYQDPQHCAICHQSGSRWIPSWGVCSQLCWWHEGRPDRPQRRNGFAPVQAIGHMTSPCSPSRDTGTDGNDSDASANPPLHVEEKGTIPQATAALLSQSMYHLVVVVDPEAGVPTALATSHEGPEVTIPYMTVGRAQWLPRSVPTPSSPTTWAMLDARVADGTMTRERPPREHREHRKSPELVSGTRCPQWTDSPLSWIWTVWTEPVQLGSVTVNSGTPRHCRVPLTQPWASSLPGMSVQTHYCISPALSHPGPKPGGRPNPTVPNGATDKSTGARVTGDCHSPVEPEVPHVGSTGKPWHEQNSQLVRVGTAPVGSLRRRPSHGPYSTTLLHQTVRLNLGPQSPVAVHSKRNTPVIPIIGEHRDLYMYSDCERKIIFCLVYKARVPVRMLRIVAPALLHLTRSMPVPEKRVSRNRLAAVGSLSGSSPQVRRAPLVAPCAAPTMLCPDPISPTQALIWQTMGRICCFTGRLLSYRAARSDIPQTKAVFQVPSSASGPAGPHPHWPSSSGWRGPSMPTPGPTQA